MSEEGNPLSRKGVQEKELLFLGHLVDQDRGVSTLGASKPTSSEKERGAQNLNSEEFGQKGGPSV